MREKIKENNKSVFVVLGAVFFTSVCIVTCFNTYKLYLLQKEIQNLKSELDICTEQKSHDIKYQNNEFFSDMKQKVREKRNIVGATDDGVLVSSESYAQHKRQNLTQLRYPGLRGLSVTTMPAQPSYFGSYVSPVNTISSSETKKSPVYIRTSRVMHVEDKSKAFKHIVKKSALKSGDTSMYSSNEYNTGSSESEFPIIHDEGILRRRINSRHRMEILDERHPRTGRMKPLPTIHFSGDTSRYVLGQHDNFRGNGHLRHAQRTFVDWMPNGWVEKTGMNSHFNMQDGYLTIRESGIYFIYAQIYYLDEHDINGYRIYKNGQIIFQCTLASHSYDRRMKGNTCYTAGAEYISEGDKISLGDLSDGRYSLFEPGKSFFGLIKLGDVKASP